MDLFPPGLIMNKGLPIRSAQQRGQKRVPRLRGYAARGKMDASYLITHRFPLELAPQGYKLFGKRDSGRVRAVFTP